MRAFRFSFVRSSLPSFTLLTSTSLSVPVRCQTTSTSSPPKPNKKPNQPWRRRFTPTRFLPRFEIHDVREDVSLGSMTRVSIDGKQLLITQYPQMGPRKLDPHDPTPQFDSSRRVSTRFRHMDLGGMVAVTKGWLPSYHVKNNAYDLTFEKISGDKGYSLHGTVHRAGYGGPLKDSEPWKVVLEDQFAIALEHFLDIGLTESFGFQQFAIAQAQHALLTEEEGTTVSTNSQNEKKRSNNSRRQR